MKRFHKIKQVREAGWFRYEALIQSGRDRLRPILMTTGPDFPRVKSK